MGAAGDTRTAAARMEVAGRGTREAEVGARISAQVGRAVGEATFSAEAVAADSEEAEQTMVLRWRDPVERDLLEAADTALVDIAAVRLVPRADIHPASTAEAATADPAMAIEAGTDRRLATATEATLAIRVPATETVHTTVAVTVEAMVSLAPVASTVAVTGGRGRTAATEILMRIRVPDAAPMVHRRIEEIPA
jgi:hypothetical protein